MNAILTFQGFTESDESRTGTEDLYFSVIRRFAREDIGVGTLTIRQHQTSTVGNQTQITLEVVTDATAGTTKEMDSQLCRNRRRGQQNNQNHVHRRGERRCRDPRLKRSILHQESVR